MNKFLSVKDHLTQREGSCKECKSSIMNVGSRLIDWSGQISRQTGQVKLSLDNNGVINSPPVPNNTAR